MFYKFFSTATVLSVLIFLFSFSGCEQPTFTSEAERLGSLSAEEMMQEFTRLGTLPGAPGPIPVGSAVGKSGLLALQDIPWLDQTQQDIAYSEVWSGKDFYLDGSVPCNPEKGGSFWVENRVEGAFKAILLLEGGGKGLIYYSDDSWTGDGLKIIQIDYADTTPAMGFIHDELRLANWDQETDTATYFGFMWIKIGTIKYAFAYFIPDQLRPFPCP